MPVSAVTAGGTPPAGGGVQNRLVGQKGVVHQGYLTPFARSVSTAKEVTSEPVPAVVGTATKRMSALSPALPNSSMALAQSRGEPPPKATTAWGGTPALGPLGHQLQGRVGHHPVEHLHGAAPQAGGTCSSRPDWARKESVITITRRPASFSRAAKASGPKKIVGLS